MFFVLQWDYMLRDDAALKIGITFNYKRFILNTDITEDPKDGKMRLSLRDKEADSVKEMFMDRARLHRKGYQHRTIKIIDRMLLDALLEADRHFTLTGPTGETFRLSEACDDVKLFSQLTDEYLVRSLQYSSKPELANTRAILYRIATRKLYKLVALIDSVNTSVDFKGLQRTLKEVTESSSSLNSVDLTILRKRVNMGMGNNNPVEKVSFFDKRGGTVVFTSDQLRKDLPKDFSSQSLLLVCKKTDQYSVREAKNVFQEWSREAFNNQEQEINLSIV